MAGDIRPCLLGTNLPSFRSGATQSCTTASWAAAMTQDSLAPMFAGTKVETDVNPAAGPAEALPAGLGVPRMLRACDACKGRKVKCSGDPDGCKSCVVRSSPRLPRLLERLADLNDSDNSVARSRATTAGCGILAGQTASVSRAPKISGGAVFVLTLLIRSCHPVHRDAFTCSRRQTGISGTSSHRVPTWDSHSDRSSFSSQQRWR
jgi:hypothetical protein